MNNLQTQLAQYFAITRRPPPPPSKHRAKPFCGKVRLGVDSGIRKLARALRRGKVPPERLQVIETALQSADRRRYFYKHASESFIVLGFAA